MYFAFINGKNEKKQNITRTWKMAARGARGGGGGAARAGGGGGDGGGDGARGGGGVKIYSGCG